MLCKLDLHCHSIASDGAETIPELAEMAVRVGLSGLVITDHCSPNNAFTMNRTILESLESVSNLQCPVIVGSEIQTPYGEFLLYGKKACEQWDHYKRDLAPIAKIFGITQYWEMFEKFVLHKVTYSFDFGRCGIVKAVIGPKLSYAMALCHPNIVDRDWCLDMPKMFWGLVHGFEIQNENIHYDQTKPEVVDFFMKNIPHCKCLRNSDHHGGDTLGMCYNEMELKEVSENQLIHWFRV